VSLFAAATAGSRRAAEQDAADSLLKQLQERARDS
jgi:dsRNA-specific ribonuclease